MKKTLSKAFFKQYSPPQDSLWTGRKSTASASPQYLHEFIMCHDLESNALPPALDCVLLGYACDEGVRRNKGRVGAAQGPEAIRKAMAKLAWHRPFFNLSDIGDICCSDQDLESSQDALAESVTLLVNRGIFPLVLGGGHDIAYGHAKGLLASEKLYGKQLGIVNLDAHFDLRLPEPHAHSGSPFAQLLEEHADQIHYLVLGIQKPANPPELFLKAEKKGVEVVEMETSLEQFKKDSLEALDRLLEQVDQVYLTIDLDGFSSAYAPGVSAPSPMGFDPFFALSVIEKLKLSGKLLSLDIAECNPTYDQDKQTAVLAARLAEKSLRT